MEKKCIRSIDPISDMEERETLKNISTLSLGIRLILKLYFQSFENFTHIFLQLANYYISVPKALILS